MDDRKKQLLHDLIIYALVLKDRGDYLLSGLFASMAFEVVVNNGRGNATCSGGDLSYVDMIRRLCSDKKYEKYAYELDLCRRKRNQIVHCYPRLEQQWVRDLVDKLCKIHGLDQDSELRRIDYEDYRRLSIKFSAPLPPRGGDKFNGLAERDFENLENMRNKLFSLTRSLEDQLHKLDRRMQFDYLSEVNPTSAYVWAAAVRDKEGHRTKVEKPSLSVLATNDSVRIYLDFGGRCLEGRIRYADFLLSDQGASYLSQLPDGYDVFDIYWYFNLSKVEGAREVARSLRTNKTENETALNDWKQQVQRAIPGGRITANRRLVGRIVPREVALKEEKRFQGLVAQTFRDLYPAYIAACGDSERTN